jgi:hypothetical protein
VRFRRRFSWHGGTALLRLTADSRYTLWVNGAFAGQGPARAWPAYSFYDVYDITAWLILGENTVAVLVQHYGEGTFQYLPGPAGLLAQIEVDDGTVLDSDDRWLASPGVAWISGVPRISVQQAFEEQYDAQVDEDWTATAFHDREWKPALVIRPAADGFHAALAPRVIPFLTAEPVSPRRIVACEAVRSLPYRVTIYVKPYLAPDDFSSNGLVAHAYLASQVWSETPCTITLNVPHKQPVAAKINGVAVDGSAARLEAGWNTLVLSVHGIYHLAEFCIAFDGPPGLRISAAGAGGGPEWVVVGPFELTAADREHAATVATTASAAVFIERAGPGATAEAGSAFWESCDVGAAFRQGLTRAVEPEHLFGNDVFLQAFTDVTTGPVRAVENEEALLTSSGWTVVHPDPAGHDVRVLLDFGREVVGTHCFEIHASAGTVLDFHNFEFIQPDGRLNFAEGMNNSSRYICRDGRQAHRTLIRRGFRYSYVILRGMCGPVRLRGVHVLDATYPQHNIGSFACSDAQLDRIWTAGAATMRACAEDTYTDCPTYEQTHWVGDARNEALVDWVVNGDSRLWLRCLEQAGQSLDRSPLVESHVPSSWQNVLPAWSFLWLRSCLEYYTWTGDRAGAERLLPFMARNVDGLQQHLDARGLFSIQAWNMFDWAAMDTPCQGVVTHQNCLAVLGLDATARLADALGDAAMARRCRDLAGRLGAAINAALWSEEHHAYTDCLRRDALSPVYSQQTQTAAHMSGVASGERSVWCRAHMHEPPPGFIRAGSPFFEFFLLEAFQQEGRAQDLLDAIRRDWGFMVDQGATTFWEMWSQRGERLTRSHCHGWSAAPTFFLSSYILGVTPDGPGSAAIRIAPRPCDLAWCRGTVPVGRTPVSVAWENRPGEPFLLRVTAPEGVDLRIELPHAGRAEVNGRSVAASVSAAL